MRKQEIPETPRPLPEGPLYFVGVGGAGMSAIAYVLAQRGVKIAGSDPGISPAARARLESVGVTVHTKHDAAQIGADTVALVATDAVNETNPEVVAARERGIPVFRRPEALAHIFNAGRGIAIAGTHGKTTTTGMVASILLAAGLKPTILIGGDLPAIGGNAMNGDLNAPGGDIVLAEACEAYDGFLYLHPEIAVITNIEADHLDFHGTEEAVFASFERFVKQIKVSGTLIVCGDDKNADKMMQVKGERGGGLTYGGLTRSSYLEAKRITLSPLPAFDLVWDYDTPERIGRVSLKVPGTHNLLNALAAAAVANKFKIAPEQIIAGLEAFTGTGRRFEKLGEVNGVLVVDDYAHHPTEIRATLSAARAAYPEHRIVAVFQPHLPSRTRDFMDDFASALSEVSGTDDREAEGRASSAPTDLVIASSVGAELALPSNGLPSNTYLSTTQNIVVLTDIYLAREQAIPGVSSETLAAKVRERNPALLVEYVPDKNALPERLAEIVRDGDLLLTMGAGDIRNAGEGLLAILQ